MNTTTACHEITCLNCIFWPMDSVSSFQPHKLSFAAALLFVLEIMHIFRVHGHEVFHLHKGQA